MVNSIIQKKLLDNFPLQSVRAISQTLFTSLLIFYLVLLILEQIDYGFVSGTFNPDIILIPLAITGILSVIIPTNENFNQEQDEKKDSKKNKYLDIALLFFLVAIGFIIIYYKLKDQGKMGLVLSIFSCLIIMVIGFVLLFGKDEEEANE